MHGKIASKEPQAGIWSTPVWRPEYNASMRSRLGAASFLQHEWTAPSGNMQEPHSTYSKSDPPFGARTFIPLNSPIPRNLSSQTHLDCHPANMNVEQVGSEWSTQSDPCSDPRWTPSWQIPSPYYPSPPPRVDSPRTAKTRGFVLESGTGPPSDSEARRPKRRGVLDEKTRAKASRVRSIGACWRCRLQKNQVRNIHRGPCLMTGS